MSRPMQVIAALLASASLGMTATSAIDLTGGAEVQANETATLELNPEGSESQGVSDSEAGSTAYALVKAAFEDAFGQPATIMDERVRRFEPSEEDIYLTFPSGKYQNLVVGGDSLRAPEQEMLAGFREWYKSEGLSVPSGWDDDRHLPVRYLQLLGGSYEKTYAEIVRLDKDYRERRVNLPAKLPEFIDELQ